MPFINLPSELIAQIFEHLQDRDFFNGRLGHRALEKASFSHFGKRYFRKRGFLIVRSSLQVLQQIARHIDLKKYLQHVWFNPDCYTFYEPDCCPELEEVDGELLQHVRTAGNEAERIERRHRKLSATLERREPVATQYSAYLSCMEDYESIVYGDSLEHILRNVFANLPNLMTVGMRRSEDYSPYGWTKLKDDIGQDPRKIGPMPYGPAEELSATTHLFTAITSALAHTKRKLERLYTDAIELENIKIDNLPEDKLTAALSSVEYIELNIVRSWLAPQNEAAVQKYNRLHHSDDFGAGLVRLFHATTHLKELGLQIFPDRRQSHLLAPTARDPASWRTSYPYLAFQRLTNEVSLSCLTRVKLEKITSTSKTLSDFLTPSSAHLTSLKLRDVRLLSSEDEPRPWASFFSFLAGHCLRLDYILFYHLMHDRGGISYIEDPPLAPPEDSEDYIENPIWPGHQGQAYFAKYDHIIMEVSGTQEVREKLEEISERHWYHPPLLSYAMDEEMWHTDTSDEEW